MKDYFIGLDVGTDSIGWAVTDKNYILDKFKGNAMWGIRLLEESNTAEERRNFRTARRRTDRNKYRLQCLETLFNEEIANVDIAFFQRLKESNLYEEDKSTETKYSLFSDSTYTDKDYHKDYPTIYHLRKDLIENKTPHDIRLVYLAISHIIKNRGHFLFDSEFVNDDEVSDFNNIWLELNQYLSDNYSISLNIDSTEQLEFVLKNSTLTKTKKKEEVADILSINKKNAKQEYSVITLLTGGTVSANELFNNEDYRDSECKSVCISSGYDENSDIYESTFGENFELIEKIKAVYDWSILANIIKDNKYISFAKVEDYNKHKSDLKLLKKYVKLYCDDKYNIIFKDNKKDINNYLAYSGHSKPTSKMSSPFATNCTQEKFCEFLKKTLPKDVKSGEYNEMYEKILAGSFMPKMKIKDNSVIPMQVTLSELKAILNNASQYLAFLNEKDKNGISVKEKIISIHSFRIPYYVGPLNKHSDKSWIVRQEGRIYPWNFEEKVDVDRSAEKFIENLTSKCTYLYKEDVIPKNSLLYSSFMVLNELNNLKLDGEKTSVELKQAIYNDLFKNKNKVSQSALKKYLKSNGYPDVEISGIDGDFKSNLKSYIDFKNINLGESEKEEIIKAITIFGDDRKLLKKRIVNKYGKKLSNDEIKSICKLKYAGWSRLSKKFLTGIYGVDKIAKAGETNSIIRFMWETNNNLMQLLSNNYTFLDAIKFENGENKFTSLKEEIKNLYVSPKVKRPIYQTMQIVEEIVKIKGNTPTKIFVEVARGPEEKQRTVSRKNRLLELYKDCKKEQADLFKQLQNVNESDLRRDSLYLYFTQFGRSMYSDTKIEISELHNKNLYDIDHIFPQSKIKDDSIDNRVLVLKSENANKTNRYPIDENIRTANHNYWKTLLNKGLISKKKYERLVRNTPLTDDELSVFISRQLVETRQSTKAIAELLEKRYPKPNTEIVYVKARLVSEFRQKFDMVKCREVNDLHHAKDAYLNIVVGNVYNTQFNHNRTVYIKDIQKGVKSVNRIFDYPANNAWNVDGERSIDIVKKTMLKNNIRFTRYSYKKKGGLFNQNLSKKAKGKVAMKNLYPYIDTSKYGGYENISVSYFCLVSYTKKEKEIRKILPIYTYRATEYENNPQNYISTAFGLDNVKIIIDCLKVNTLVSINNFRMHISGNADENRLISKSAVQLILGYASEKYIKYISNYLQKCIDWKIIKEITEFDKITLEENILLYDKIIDKLGNTNFNVKYGHLYENLLDSRERFLNISLYEQCFTLIQILKILHTDTVNGDLSFLNRGKNIGALRISKTIENSKEIASFKIIHQSITGLYEQEIELI